MIASYLRAARLEPVAAIRDGVSDRDFAIVLLRRPASGDDCTSRFRKLVLLTSASSTLSNRPELSRGSRSAAEENPIVPELAQDRPGYVPWMGGYA